jgi:hypothetical protein
MAAAIAVVRHRIEGMAPYEAAMSGLVITKYDTRGRVRREISGRALVALAHGEPRSDLFPGPWTILDDAVAAGCPVELALVPEGAWHERERWSLVARIQRTDAGGTTVPESVVLWVVRNRREIEDAMHEAGRHLPSKTGADEVAAPAAWLVRLSVGGRTGWTLWLDGDPDVLLARNGRVPLYNGPDALASAIRSEAGSFSPRDVSVLDEPSLRAILEGPPAVVDFDAAAAWFADPDREVTTQACDRALNALNMAIDVGATVGDRRLAALVDAPALGEVHDALTFGLTLLGDGSPYRDDPAAMSAAISPDAAAAATSLVSIVREHVDLIEEG